MTWLDEAGAPIEAHGAGMLQHDGRYYWFGEEKKRTFVRRFVETVACYSANSLAGPWRNHGRVLAQEEIRHPQPRPQRNRPTKQPRFGGWVRNVIRALLLSPALSHHRFHRAASARPTEIQPRSTST
mmetsp:Transcript_42842/g.138989  ORF Transcript_42842/g.138989 Transcript_42842/m.138989 type:complete len:127 (-) Transcript_42842:1312-1692(-)